MRCTNKQRGTISVCYRKKQMGVSFPCVSPVIDNTFRHNIVKVVRGSTRLSWIHSYFDNVMTTFMINNRTDAWKTDVNLTNQKRDVTIGTITRSVQLPYSVCETVFSQVGFFTDKPFPGISFQ